MRKNVPSDMCAKQRLTSGCAPAQLIREFVVRMKNEETAFLIIQNALSDDSFPNLCQMHMSEGTFSNVAAHTVCNVYMVIFFKTNS